MRAGTGLGLKRRKVFATNGVAVELVQRDQVVNMLSHRGECDGERGGLGNARIDASLRGHMFEGTEYLKSSG